MKDRLLTACLVGGGNRSREHCLTMRLRNNLCIAGVCDPFAGNAREWLTAHSVPFYNSLELMLANAKPDFAAISVPHHVHLETVDMVSSHAMHMMKEKPLARTVDEALKVLSLCFERNVNLFITLQRRFSYIYRRFLAAIPHVGKLKKFTAEYTLGIDQPALGWRASRKTAGGGAIIDMGYHMIDLLLWFFGMPDSAKAKFKDAGGDSVENEAKLSFGYPSGLTCEIFISRSARPKSEEIRLIGEDGALFANREVFEEHDGNGDVVDSVEDASDWSFLLSRQLAFFLESITVNAGDVSCVDHLNHACLIEALYASKKEGRAVNPYWFLPDLEGLNFTNSN